MLNHTQIHEDFVARIRPRGKTLAEQPEPIDLLVGKRMRQRRQFLEMSQEDMADKIGVSRQQYIKYEFGKDRMAASRLYEAARALQIDTNFFFDLKASQSDTEGNLSDDERRLLRAYRALPDEQKPHAFKVVRALAA